MFGGLRQGDNLIRYGRHRVKLKPRMKGKTQHLAAQFLCYGDVGGVGWPAISVQLLAMKRRVEVTPHLDVVSAKGSLQIIP